MRISVRRPCFSDALSDGGKQEKFYNLLTFRQYKRERAAGGRHLKGKDGNISPDAVCAADRLIEVACMNLEKILSIFTVFFFQLEWSNGMYIVMSILQFAGMWGIFRKCGLKGSPTRVVSTYVPVREKKGLRLTGNTADETAEKLMELLARSGKL